MKTAKEIQDRISVAEGYVADLESELDFTDPTTQDFTDTFTAIQQHKSDIALLKWVLGK